MLRERRGPSSGGIRAVSTVVLLGCAVAAGPLAAGQEPSAGGLRLSERSAVVSGKTLEAGHLRLRLEAGQVTPVLFGSKTVGLFFTGSGTFEYRSEWKVEHPVVRYNLKKNSGPAPVAADEALIVKDGVGRALWMGRVPEGFVGAADSAAASLSAAAWKLHREKFDKIDGASPAAFLAGALDPAAPTDSPALAEIGGLDSDWRWVRDPLAEKSERLALVRKISSSDPELRRRLFLIEISEQAVGRDPREPKAPNWLLTAVDLDLHASAGREATLKVVETIVPNVEGLSILGMRLRSVFWDVVGSGRLEPRTMEVESVADAAGRSLEFEHEAGRLLVHMGAPAAKGRPLQLTFAIRGDFLIRPAGDSFWMLGTYPWFPQPAEPGGQAYTLRTKISVPKPFVPFAPGKTLTRQADGDRHVVVAELAGPVQFASVLAGKYSSEEETRGPLTIRVSSYAMKNARAMKQLRNFAFGIIEFYERFLGPFPFPELDIIEINDWGFGQAPPGVIFITQEAFNPLQGEVNQLFSQGINERFAHEIAHQWWGGSVRTPDEENEWIAESFAEYSAALFLKAAKGQRTYDDLVSSWRGRSSRASDAAPIVLANRVDVPDGATQFEVRTGLLYDKGALLLATLHKELGDQTFLTFLKSYQTSFKGKTASTSTVEGLLEFLTKKDYTDFFNRYCWGTEMPPK
jgi:hypothetical protein